MANDDHIAQLMKGVAAWNAWRDENSKIRPDLSVANLSGANLREANLFQANLSEADSAARTSAARTAGLRHDRPPQKGRDHRRVPNRN
jgi:uncharacterized protein YjbI with pentapeptide repeats